jgi:hypothetical protein
MTSSTKVGIAVAAALGVALVVGVAAFVQDDSRVENANIKRGRDLLAIAEPDAAIRELRIALKSEPHNRDAKALLLVALMRTDGALTGWYEMQILFERLRHLEKTELASLDGVPALKKLLTESRQELYDKGLDTKDADELWQVTRDAARYSFVNAEEEEKDYAAFVLALHDDEQALAFLVDRLKSETATWVPRLLTRLSDQAEEPLLAIARDPENLGRKRALDTLASLREREAAIRVFTERATVRGLLDSDIAPDLRPTSSSFDFAVGLTRDEALYGVNLRDGLKAAPLRVQWVSLDGEGTWRVLVLQAFDETSRGIVTTFYAFQDGLLQPLSLDAPPDIVERLATEGPLLGGESSGSGFRIRQIGRGAVPVLQETKRSHFATGDRVRVRAIKIDGVVQGTDEFGLLKVLLDQPHRGMRELELTASAVRGLESVLQDRIGQRVYEGHVDGKRLALKAVGDALLPL